MPRAAVKPVLAVETREFDGKKTTAWAVGGALSYAVIYTAVTVAGGAALLAGW